MVSAIVLAAGTSSRMQSPKQLLLYQGRPLLRHVIETLSRSKVEKILVVLGHRHTEVAATLEGLPVDLVYNPNYASGQSSSVKAGLKALVGSESLVDLKGSVGLKDLGGLISPKVAETSCKGVLFVLGDQPLLKIETINLLIDNFYAKGGIVAPYYHGIRGNPVLFDLSYLTEFEVLQGDIGAREIIYRHPDDLHKIEVTDPGILLDIDTPTDFALLTTKDQMLKGE
ncbi:MAG: nucleotidyltransferase family protein [Clostridia bacterium]|nr:nucleotidyltransferase family protein [Clostridia bacterium]